MIARQAALQDLAEEEFDVVVVGGGITGAGVAFDAAVRGYAVALIERGDFASGTSSRSSKLVHGGLRYLQHFDLGLVREALLERRLMVRLAPHLVKPLPLVVAAFDRPRPDRLTGVGLNLYDVMAVTPRVRRYRRRRVRRAGPAAIQARAQESALEADWSPQRHRLIDGEEVLKLLPAFAGRRPSGGYLFYDCQTDDARLVLTVLEEADRFGAVIANRVEAVGLVVRGGRACAVKARDVVGGADLEIRGANLVNATGVWADRLRPGELGVEAEVPKIRPSRGTHIVFSQEQLPLVAGAIVPAGDGRTIFALPWLGATLIGTTDNDYEGPLDHVPPEVAEVEYLLEAVNEFFGRDLEADAIAGCFAGVRPLISSADAKRSVDISRKAELYETSSGMLTITGGKLTTWRRMAKQTVDRIVEREGREAPCRTHEIPLGRPVSARSLPRVEGLSPAAYDHLAARYGRRARELLSLVAKRPDLGAAILPGHPDLLVEAVYAARHEQALTLADLLLRRTRLGVLAARTLLDRDQGEGRRPRFGRRQQPGRAALKRLAEVAGEELGWSRRRRDQEVKAFYEEAGAEGLLVDLLDH